MLHILVSYAFRDTFYGHAGIFQQGTGFFHPDIFYNISESFPGFLPDVFGKIGFGQMHFFCKLIQCHCQVMLLNVIHNLIQPVIPALLGLLNLFQFIYSHAKGLNGRFDDILVNSHTPVQLAIAGNSHIGYGFGRRSSGQGMFFVYGQFIAYIKILLQCIAHRVQTSVSVACHTSFLPAMIHCHFCQHTVFLPEMAFRNLEMRHMFHIMFFKNLIYQPGRQFHVPVV